MVNIFMRMFETAVRLNIHILSLVLIFILSINSNIAYSQSTKLPVKALYIPLADHYAALVAYERYKNRMKYADFQIQQMKNWDYLRAYFQAGEVDMAFVMSPLAMDMFHEKPHFRWIGLMHRDGNALAINELLNKDVQLSALRKDRKPDYKVAKVLKQAYANNRRATEIAMPHLLSTHTVILYRYLKNFGVKLSLIPNTDAEVLAISVAPPKSPAFIKTNNARTIPAAFEQSLPWADIVETGGFGKVAWYSKDVMPWKNGHVECIAVASDKAIKNKFKAIKEVMFYIRKAGDDIESARNKGGDELEAIVNIVRKHIKAHTRKAIIASLSKDLRVINYEHLNIDHAGLEEVMKYAVEGEILKSPIDIDAFADHRFDSK